MPDPTPPPAVDTEPVVTVVGVGADGRLDEDAARLVRDADVLLGGTRHLADRPAVPGQQRLAWPSPLADGLPALLEEVRGRRVVALASGDPLVSGIGATLVRLLGASAVRVVPAVSSVALARARMGWSAEESVVVTLVGRHEARLLRELAPGRRVLLLTSGPETPARVGGLLTEAGHPDATVTLLADLGSPGECRDRRTARGWASVPAADVPELHVLAVELRGDPGRTSRSPSGDPGRSSRSPSDAPGRSSRSPSDDPGWSRRSRSDRLETPDPAPLDPWLTASWTAGLPDDAFEHDGQLTKRDLRASALARLRPAPGQHLWDVGAGAGSIGIEWMRAHPTCRTTAIESHPDRTARIERNATRLGVPDLVVVEGRAPDALAGLPAPDAVFIGGGATRPGVLAACLAALRPGGRLVVHGVTLETESLLADAYRTHGGELSRLAVETAAPVGTFTGWTPARTVTQWCWTG